MTRRFFPGWAGRLAPFTSMKLLQSSLLCVAAVLGLGSCGLFLPKPDFKPHDRRAVVPQDFLFSTYKPLNDYLDTPVHVQITEVPLTQVFDLPVLDALNYEWTRRPKDNPPVTVHRIGMTRRQLLWAMAQDHTLTMLPVINPRGHSYIEIRSREQ